MNAIRAGPMSHAPTCPRLPSTTEIAAAGTRMPSSGPAWPTPRSIPCSSPETMFTSPAGTRMSMAAVPMM